MTLQGIKDLNTNLMNINGIKTNQGIYSDLVTCNDVCINHGHRYKVRDKLLVRDLSRVGLSCRLL